MGLVRTFEIAFLVRLSFFHLLVHLLLMPSTCDGRAVLCHPQERTALLQFKDGLSDATMISSWGAEGQEEDCCSWSGIGCDNRTGHVVELDLGHGLYEGPQLRGKIGSSLVALEYLQRLDLSGNDFEGGSIPPFLGSFKRLTYLDLSSANFVGVVPQGLGNLTSLHVLNLSDIYRMESDGEWFSRLHKLQALNLRFRDLTGANKLLEVLNTLPFLEILHLYFSDNDDIPLPPPHVKFSRLTKLAISGSRFTNPCWLFNITSLEYLDLYFDDIHVNVCRTDFTTKLCSLKSWALRSFQMPITMNLTRFFTECDRRLSLVSLDLSGNSITGQLPGWLGDYKSLQTLELSSNNLWGSIPESIGGMTSLTYLDLIGNRLTGSIPQSIGGLQSLKQLSLSDNNLSGPLPSSLWGLKSLQHLDLSRNRFQGNLSEEDFVHLGNLDILDLSSNSLLQVMLPPRWTPPFNLTRLGLGSCKLGPSFPLWLQTQNQLTDLNMSDAGISDVLPQWIWSFSSNLSVLDMSMNNLRGVVPVATNTFKLWAIILHSNMLQGSLSSFPAIFDRGSLLLSNNLLSGPININMSSLSALSLSRNNFTGGIPPSICEAKGLNHLDLSHNRLTGQIPSCSTKHTCGIRSLHLNNNNLHGTLPMWLWNCTDVYLLDMGENNFSGEIPTWISNSMLNLKVLRLRSNSFFGSIPVELSNLTSLQVLDLANNCFSGSIPPTFGNFISMKLPPQGNEVLGFPTGGYYQESIMVASKGIYQIEPQSILKLFTSIDLSMNKLSGNIPADIGMLFYLRNLNLSHNYLHGCIPKTFAKLSQLESLDLSCNNISGEIPQTLSELTSLNSFNVSFNSLSGRIPSGRQFDTFTNSSYMGNSKLCGKPLQVVCQGNPSPPVSMQSDQKDHLYFLWHCMSIVLGFIMGFWTFLGTLFFKSKWRYAYFQFVDNQCEKFYRLAKFYMEKCKRMCMKR